ncbi:AMP-binding enzyme [Mycolicibacterium baixiangningiae]|uniref:AMP-binding enzyme n=1 Tax=Mycolicibacterium baixiangningiae TaxID=2761578 RepID=UPI0018670601
MIPPRPTIPALLAQSVREFGDRTYLVSPTDRLTYADAERRSAELARWLLAEGVGKGARVAVPEGTVGELLVRGIGVMAGYNKRERAETFDADGWYHTADRVYRREGDPRLFYGGRTSELIKAAGANVSPLEVEAVIAQFPDVAQCVVIGVDDPERGEQVCAVVVPAAGGVDVTDLAARTRALLSSYKVPTRWSVVTADRLATLPSGKLNRRAVKELIVDKGLPLER